MKLSKRHVILLSLIFLLKCFSKSFLIRSLKRCKELDLFRRLEKLSIKQIKCDGAIEFLRLCQSFGLTPTFAKIDETRSKKWTQSSEQFASNVIVEELRHKSQQNNILKKEIREIYSEIRQKCSTFRFLCILKTIAMLRKQAYQKMADDHSSKIARLLYRDVDVDEHIQNISSYNLSFFDKLVLCRGLQSL